MKTEASKRTSLRIGSASRATTQRGQEEWMCADTYRDAVVYVLKGSVLVHIDGERLHAPEGLTVTLPAGCRHDVVAESDEASVLILRMLSKPTATEPRRGTLESWRRVRCSIRRSPRDSRLHEFERSSLGLLTGKPCRVATTRSCSRRASRCSGSSVREPISLGVSRC